MALEQEEADRAMLLKNPVSARYRTKQELVVARLRDAILEEEFAPGQWLRLRDLAQLLGTSTMPIREALQVLASEGLVTLSPHRGAQVAPLSAEEFEELYMARLGLEGLAARLGAERISDEDLDRMRSLLQTMEQAIAAGDTASFLDQDTEFHMLHYRASGRPTLIQRIEQLRKSCARYTRRTRATLADTDATRRFHREILAACATRDGARAEQIVRQDLDSTVAYMRRHLFNGEPGWAENSADFALKAGHMAGAES